MGNGFLPVCLALLISSTTQTASSASPAGRSRRWRKQRLSRSSFPTRLICSGYAPMSLSVLYLTNVSWLTSIASYSPPSAPAKPSSWTRSSEVKEMAKHESIFDWTIGEIEEVCRKSKSCRNCEAREVCESIQVFAPPPGKWKLGKPRFTEEEIDTCRLLQKLYPGSIGIARGNNRRDFVVYGEGDRVLAFITSTAFGNLKIWENARFSDVLGNSL